MFVHDCASSMVVVAVDVGKNTVACSVTDEKRHRLLGPVDFAMTKAGLRATLAKICGSVPFGAAVKVGIEGGRALPPAADGALVVADGLATA